MSRVHAAAPTGRPGRRGDLPPPVVNLIFERLFGIGHLDLDPVCLGEMTHGGDQVLVPFVFTIGKYESDPLRQA